jgi:EthD domain
MMTAFHLLVPRRDINSDEFTRIWRDEYRVQAAERLSGAARRYIRTPASGESPLASIHGDPTVPYLGVDAFGFDTVGDALAFPGSDAYREAVGATEGAFLDLDRSTWLVTHERLLTDGAPRGQADTGPGVKTVVTFDRAKGQTIDDCYWHWEHVHAPMSARSPGVSRVARYEVVAEEHRRVEKAAYDAVAVAWWRSQADFDTFFAAASMAVDMAEDIPRFTDMSTYYSLVCRGEEDWVFGD